jgi:hypothetical protein
VKPWCQHPDRDQPKLTCGYPLPCPWHTAVLDLESDPPRIVIPITSDAAKGLKLKRLRDIGELLATPRAKKKQRKK